MSARYSGIRKLRKFVAGPVERCDFCRGRLGEDHPHLVESESLRLLCACAPCLGEAEAGGPYRRIAPHREKLAFALDDADWAALHIPIDVAFLFRPAPGGAPVALFPGPAGATRSPLSVETWNGLAEKYPLLNDLESGVEALLVNRAKGKREYYRVSTDHCYALAGLLRTHWRGLAGGEEAWAAIASYFASLGESEARHA